MGRYSSERMFFSFGSRVRLNSSQSRAISSLGRLVTLAMSSPSLLFFPRPAGRRFLSPDLHVSPYLPQNWGGVPDGPRTPPGSGAAGPAGVSPDPAAAGGSGGRGGAGPAASLTTASPAGPNTTRPTQ